MKMHAQFLRAFSLTIFISSMSRGRASAPMLKDLPSDLRPQIDPYFAPVLISLSVDSQHFDRARGDTGTEKGSEFVCPSHSGNFPDPEDCASYYRCRFKIIRKMKCPKKEKFDKNLKRCVDESWAACADSNDDKRNNDFRCPYPYGPFAHPKDCSRFYFCRSSKPTLKNCKQEQLFHQKIRRCMDKIKVDCGSKFNPYTGKSTTTVTTTKRTKKTKPPQTHTTPLTTTREDKKRSTWTTSPTTLTSSTTPSSTQAIISSSASTGIDTTEETDSSLTSRITTDSNEGTIRWHSTEDEVTTPAETPPAASTGTTPETSTGDPLTSTDSLHSFVCPKRTGTFPAPSDCSKYYLCKQLVATVHACEEGTLFHETYGFCYDAKDVDCGTRPRPDEHTSINTFPTTVSPDMEFTCPWKNGNFPVSHDCSRYYSCRMFKFTLEECEEGTLFHEKYGFCYNAAEVDCGTRKVPSEYTSESPSTITSSQSLESEFVCHRKTGNFPVPQDCSLYYSCRKFKFTIEKCIAGTLFHEKYGFCYNAQEVDCGRRSKTVF